MNDLTQVHTSARIKFMQIDYPNCIGAMDEVYNLLYNLIPSSVTYSELIVNCNFLEFLLY